MTTELPGARPTGAAVFRQPAWRRYIVRYSLGMGGFIGLLLPMALLAWSHRLPPAPWRYAITAAPALPVGVVVWSMLRYLEEETDEYQRLLNVRGFVAATGMVLVLTTGWGLMQWFAELPKVSMFNVFLLFLACQSVATAWVRWRAR